METEPAEKPQAARRSPVTPGQRAEEEALLRRYAKNPTPALKEDLAERFMPLARSFAMRYRGGTEPAEDLVQVAALGLVKAIEGYDPARGTPFLAYAAPTILGELRRYFRDHVWQMHLPRRLQELVLAVEGARRRLSEKGSGDPSPAAIAAEIGEPEADVREAIRAGEARRTASLDAGVTSDGHEVAPLVETVGEREPGFDRVESQLATESAELADRELEVLRARFVDGENQSEIGADLGISQMQVSRIQRRALGKLAAAVRGGDEIEESVVEPAKRGSTTIPSAA